DVPASVPYVRADAVRARQWSARIPGAHGLRVGIAWSGNPRHGNDRHRSIPLSAFRRIDPGGVVFVSVQQEVREADRAALGTWHGLLDVGSQLRDFGETAALLECLDLVVTVDTSV